jgi:uncharacterized protein YlxW (UPF0749 family)
MAAALRFSVRLQFFCAEVHINNNSTGGGKLARSHYSFKKRQKELAKKKKKEEKRQRKLEKLNEKSDESVDQPPEPEVETNSQD